MSAVAPRTGAWIETYENLQYRFAKVVAPRTGAWIETSRKERSATSPTVAPRTGAWIETQNGRPHYQGWPGRAPHGRVD